MGGGGGGTYILLGSVTYKSCRTSRRAVGLEVRYRFFAGTRSPENRQETQARAKRRPNERGASKNRAWRSARPLLSQKICWFERQSGRP